MPVSRKHKCIFVHIPKTAGTSIEYALGMHGDLEHIGVEPYKNQQVNQDTLFGAESQHYSASELNNVLGGELFDSYFKFSFVRNPWDRLVSHAAWKADATGQLKWHRKVEVSQEEVSATIQHLSKVIQDGGVPHAHLKEQWQSIYDDHGNCLVDYVGRFECLNDGWAEVCRHIDAEADLEKRMSSVRRDYRQYFTPETAKIIGDIYNRDCELFGYSFDGR